MTVKHSLLANKACIRSQLERRILVFETPLSYLGILVNRTYKDDSTLVDQR